MGTRGLLRRCGAICGVSIEAQYERRSWLRPFLGERALHDLENHLADDTYDQGINRIDYSVRTESMWGAGGFAEAAASLVASAET